MTVRAWPARGRNGTTSGNAAAWGVARPVVHSAPPLLAQREDDRRSQHHRGRGGAIVVSAARCQPRPAAALGLLVAVGHVCGVVVVGHDDRPLAVAARDYHDDVTLS